jgi:hypothetical protein
MQSRLSFMQDFCVKIACALGLSMGGFGCEDDVSAREYANAHPDVQQPVLDHGCAVSEPVLIGGLPTGFERCVDRPELEHRVAVLDCPDYVRSTAQCPSYDSWDDKENRCQTDADCGSNDYCDKDYCYCRPIGNCKRDSDCDPQYNDMTCHCGEALGECVYRGCVTDADCQEGLLCVAEKYSVCSGEFHCQKPQDTCISNADCPNPYPQNQIIGCVRWSEGAACSNCGSPGRPFLVDGHVRTATAAHFVSRAWLLDGLTPDLDAVSESERSARSARSARWVEIGLMEHASIAAFARSAMQLMSVGAPADLISATTQAMMDETKHARWAFSLASVYAGHVIAPGPISIDQALENNDLESLFVTTILEGCIGETVAAVDAREDAARATDPCEREVLLQIAEDETQHAILAWKTVQWMLGVRPALHNIFWSCLRATAATGDGSGDGSLRAAVLNAVIAPCAQAVLSRASSSVRAERVSAA